MMPFACKITKISITKISIATTQNNGILFLIFFHMCIFFLSSPMTTISRRRIPQYTAFSQVFFCNSLKKVKAFDRLFPYTNAFLLTFDILYFIFLFILHQKIISYHLLQYQFLQYQIVPPKLLQHLERGKQAM